MKKIVIILALFIFLKPVIPVLDYMANYEYIAKELCINKAKPQMHCNGKCHLMKQLAQSSETEKPVQNDKKISVFESEWFYTATFYLEIYKKPKFVTTKNTYIYKNLYQHLFGFDFFHPPIFIF